MVITSSAFYESRHGFSEECREIYKVESSYSRLSHTKYKSRISENFAEKFMIANKQGLSRP